MECAGMIADIYKLARGLESPAPIVWLGIHCLVAITGYRLLGKAWPAALAPAEVRTKFEA
jgi:hypothetical protein